MVVNILKNYLFNLKQNNVIKIQNILNINKYNFNHNHYDFMYWRYISFFISTVLVSISIISLSICGIHWSIDFTGGILIELKLDQKMELDQIQDILIKNGLNHLLVQNFNNNYDVLIRTVRIPTISNQELGNNIINIINNKIPSQHAIIKHIEYVGPNINNDCIKNGIIALVISLLFILTYLNFRFELRLGIGAVLALIHDVIITIGALSIFHIEVNPTVIASLMSVIGYSLNDSIVVFDRIRENFYKIKNFNTYYIINLSLNQIIKRTIITSVTTTTVAVILLIFGGNILHSFSITLIIGIIIGTISSIYIASALALELGVNYTHLL